MGTFYCPAFEGGAPEFGWLTSAQTISGLFGGLPIGWMENRTQANQLADLIAVNGLLILLRVNLSSLPMAVLLILLAGIPIVGFLGGVDTILQGYVADRYRRRVFGALGTSMAIFTFLGRALATLLGGQLGSVSMLTLRSLLDMTAGFLAFLLLYNAIAAQPNLEIE